MPEEVKNKKSTKSNTNDNVTEVEENTESQWYYFYSVGCGFCKKVEPIIDELNK